VMFLCAIAVAGAIQTILDLSRPFDGIVRVSGQHDPALRQPQMPAVFWADRDHDPDWFPGFENHHNLIGLARLKYGSTKSSRLPAGASRMGAPPFLATVLDPVLKLLGDIT
jgi:hypothetical protein